MEYIIKDLFSPSARIELEKTIEALRDLHEAIKRFHLRQDLQVNMQSACGPEMVWKPKHERIEANAFLEYPTITNYQKQ